MTCRVCGSRAARRWRDATSSDVLLSRRRTYALERCDACGSAWIADADRLDEDASLYSGGSYAATSSRLEPAIEPLRRVGDRDRLRWIRPLRPGARVFEVGAGDGRLLEALRRSGFEVAGSEPSPPYAAACRALGLDVVDAPIETLSLERESVDAVVLWHVLEHLDEPAGTLPRIRDWLAPGGFVVIAVPNLDSVQAMIGGDAWFHQDVPRHRTQFTTRGLSMLLGRCGFCVAATSTAGLDQSLLGMGQTLLNRLTADSNVLLRLAKSRRVRPRDVAVAVLSAPILAPLALGLEAAAQLAGRGGSLVVRAAVASDGPATR